MESGCIIKEKSLSVVSTFASFSYTKLLSGPSKVK
jgi:hypothetical protein